MVNRRGMAQIWGCLSGYAAQTPPNLDFLTANLSDPKLNFNCEDAKDAKKTNWVVMGVSRP